MKRLIWLFFALIATPCYADLRVFSCEPEWAALAEEIGGARVTAFSATTALQDPHYIQARPSLIAKLRRADLVVCSGAQLEIGWLPMLLNKANNARVRPGSAGFLEASTLVRRLEVPGSLDRSQGDMHPQGNPHVQMNPHNISIVAQALTDRMQTLDPEVDYAAGLESFLTRWQAAMTGWTEKAAALAGRRIIVHHKSWAYLADWLQLDEVGQLEPVPGVPPSAAHLSGLLAHLGTDGSGADVILRAPFQDRKASQWLSERTHIPALMLPLSVGGSESATNLFTLFDDILDRLGGTIQ